MRGTLATIALLAVLLLAGCATEVRPCPAQPFVGLSQMGDFADDEGVPFRFPLDDSEEGGLGEEGHFCSSARKSETLVHYHAAEDYYRPAGTPVYAMADGEVGFSGTMRGYGWLVIVEHPEANIYSLYGHLSPSRWGIERGAQVEKGDLLGHLGDEWENGGTEEEPLLPHLHLGVRAGQMDDYSGMGEWRWMAGWIEPCPTDVGWLRPSEVISAQEIPTGGFVTPERPLLEAWGMELLFIVIFLVAVTGMLVQATRKERPLMLVPLLVLLSLAGMLLSVKATLLGPTLWGLVAMVVVVGVRLLIVRRKGREEPASSG
jgi:hypothetical protein